MASRKMGYTGHTEHPHPPTMLLQGVHTAAGLMLPLHHVTTHLGILLHNLSELPSILRQAGARSLPGLFKVLPPGSLHLTVATLPSQNIIYVLATQILKTKYHNLQIYT